MSEPHGPCTKYQGRNTGQQLQTSAKDFIFSDQKGGEGGGVFEFWALIMFQVVDQTCLTFLKNLDLNDLSQETMLEQT